MGSGPSAFYSKPQWLYSRYFRPDGSWKPTRLFVKPIPVRLKKYPSVAFVLAITLAFFGCYEEKWTLYRKDGTWKTTKLTQHWSVQGTLMHSISDTIITEITFEKDGTGSVVEYGQNKAITWSLTGGGDQLNLCIIDGGIANCTQHYIWESTKNSLKMNSQSGNWRSLYEFYYEFERK